MELLCLIRSEDRLTMQIESINTTPMGLHLEDFEVGMTFFSGTYPPLTATQIVEFASEFDPQPFHLDPIAARDTFFEGLAASGWHTAAISMRLLVQSVPVQGGLIGAGSELAWPLAVRPGDVLRLVVTVQNVRGSLSKPDRGYVVVQMETLNQNDEVVQRGKARMLAFKKPTA